MAQNEWQAGPNGQTYVNGVLALPSDAYWIRVLQEKVIDQWGPLLAKESKRTGVPWPWLVGITMAESNGNPRAISVINGKEGAYGLMQIMPFNYPKFFGRSATREEMLTPEINAYTGANYIADLIAHGIRDLPRIASGYNAGVAGTDKNGNYISKTCAKYNCTGSGTERVWGPTPTDSLYAEHDYISRVVRSANYASQRMPSGFGTGVGLGTVVVVGGLGYLGYRWYKGRK